jgi:hypothetical protein
MDDEKLREYVHSLCNLQKNLKHCNFIGCHPWVCIHVPKESTVHQFSLSLERSGSKLFSLGQLHFMKEIGPSCTRMDVFHRELPVSSLRKKHDPHCGGSVVKLHMESIQTTNLAHGT